MWEDGPHALQFEGPTAWNTLVHYQWLDQAPFIHSFPDHQAQETKKKKKKKNAENQQLTPLPTMAMEHSIRRLYCKLLSHSLVNAHLGCFQTWAIVRKATISKQKGKTAEKKVKAQWKHMTKIIAGTWVKGGGWPSLGNITPLQWNGLKSGKIKIK